MRAWIAATLLVIPVVTHAQVMTPGDQPLNTPVDLMLPDPATRSGWIRVEVAVLTDGTPSALASETWEATPTVRYPAQWRWLTDLDEYAALLQQFPGSAIETSERGALTVTLPPPERPTLDELPDSEAVGDGAAPDSDTPAPTIDPLTGRATETPNAEAVPLESLGPRRDTDTASDDWLAPFDNQQSLNEAAAQLAEGADSTSQTPPDAEPLPPTPEPPPEPEPFLRRPTTLLADGLTALSRQRGTPAAIQAAWVQPPGARNLPLILDRSGDDVMWPAVQGFLELRRSSELRVGVNFWLNTAGDYLPPGFAMDPPPRAPQRITVLDPIPAPLLDTELGPGVDLAADPVLRPSQSQANTDLPARPSGQITYMDPSSGLEVTGEAITETGVEAGDSWPYTHLIAVADTRPVPENGVRYFDHPVVQVLVTWRELTWGEVWALGEEDKQRRLALIPEAAPDDEPVSTIPPHLLDRR